MISIPQHFSLPGKITKMSPKAVSYGVGLGQCYYPTCCFRLSCIIGSLRFSGKNSYCWVDGLGSQCHPGYQTTSYILFTSFNLYFLLRKISTKKIRLIEYATIEMMKLIILQLKLQVNRPLIGTIRVSISGACSRISKVIVPCPLHEQLNMSNHIDIEV